ncbi:MAG TPA: tRNA (adenosine(37)-N6)-threonylcarbamoyltransferase complex dimerization subunit type 1 TsaB [Chitinophagaceae bacterium]|nr:tRNA (adenosine(37)-N6)-threonylcarbamoyltransferase complex dimerization subunit type 1 TsaB [Chitinophagaceae bacterium]
MALILHIDTSMQIASIALSSDEKLLRVVKNENMKDHAAWIHHAIESILKECDKKLSDLKAIAVVEGPGSYTGLRVGMATAKGLCFSLGIPLITESSLRLMAFASISKNAISDSNTLLVPMIDARRMEVFTAIYDFNLNEISAPSAVILEPSSFGELAKTHKLILFGNGSSKFREIAAKPFDFIDSSHDASDLAPLAFQKFKDEQFADLAYSEPAYLKEFYTHTKK